MTLEKRLDNNEQKKYNLMFIGTPDTEARVEKIKDLLTQTLEEEVEMQIVPFKKFSNTAWDPILKESVRGKHVYVYADVESNYQAQELMADMNSRYMFIRGILNDAALFGAKTINVIFSMYPYSRSDKGEKIGIEPTQKRKPIYAQIVAADLKNHGVDYIFTIDIHNPSTLSMYGGERNDPIAINIPHSWVIKQGLMKHGITGDFEMGSTDAGGTDKLQKLMEDMHINGYVAFKLRDFTKPGKVNKLFIEKGFAQITGKDIVLYDDMIDTAGTLEAAVLELQKHNPKSITIISTHGLFNGKAIQILQNLYNEGKISAVYVTDTVYRENLPEFIKIIGTEEIIARQIARKSQGKPLDPNWSGVEENN